MPDYLKGNYKSPKITSKEEARKDETPEFEKKALERLGGSIAFVMKSKTFLWTPDADKKADKPESPKA